MSGCCRFLPAQVCMRRHSCSYETKEDALRATKKIDEIFTVLSIERPGWVLINAEVDTREEALEYQQWAEYVKGEVSWIVCRTSTHQS